ncbi:uncharacterized protein LOC113148669 isoform X1 [Anabas testudineus]|uniref:uncharacterized protein LOC113148669 isoform X1 n=1 Tax=Anabas testudineus TaxID=64144 RepID=UPI000E45AD82|nr:uncharacterized protein LOC113148669 isoform X1 [Anabas testudineus]XP_026196228.1 uncharacterized protein LOC113148669 isoform X1 [Anabas testudineus]
MEPRCSHCAARLENGPKGYKRKSLLTVLNLRSAQVLFPHLNPKGAFLCYDCVSAVTRKTKRCGKRRVYVEPDPDSSPAPADPPAACAPGEPPAPSQPTETPGTPLNEAGVRVGLNGTKEHRCSHCAARLANTPKGYKRRSLLTVLDLRSARILFPHLNPKDAFLCYDCVSVVTRKTKRCGKRRVYVEPVSSPGEPPPPKQLKKRPGLNEHDYASQEPPPAPRPVRFRHGGRPRVCDLLQKKNLASNLRRLQQVSGFKEALMKICAKLISSERKAMVNDLDGPLRKTFTPENLSSFSWDKTTSWAEEKAPLTVACLRAMFPPTKKIQKQKLSYVRGNNQRQLTEEEVKQMLDRRVTLLLSVPLYTSTNRCGFLQTAFSVEMLRHRCPIRLFSITNSLGISQCKTATRFHSKRLAAEHDKQVKQWRDEIQTTKRTQFCCDESKKAAAYTFSWGKVRVPSVSSADRGNTFTTWAFRFAHQVRVNFRYLQGPAIKAVEVSPHSILPSKQTYELLRLRMKTIVMRIIADNLKALRGVKPRVVKHIPHTFSHLMKEQSTSVSLGAVIPNITEDSVSIAYSLKNYIPVHYGKPYHILCCGDITNTDKTEQSKTQNRETPERSPNLKFDGLVEAPQEFQKEHLFHEEMIKMLLSEKSEKCRGSLHHIVSLFDFKTFNNTAKDYFLNMWDFITFVTTAYVTLFAVTECSLDSVTQKPTDYPSQSSEQLDWLSNLAHRLVDLVWMPPPQEDINAVAAEAAGQSDREKKKTFPFCYCREEKPGEKLVRCCSNLCPAIWFHESCARAQTLSDPHEDWFCSPECSSDGTYIYCHCKEQKGGEMIQCGLTDKCRRHEWYHRDCLTAAEQNRGEQTPWFCSESCLLAADGEDYLLNYTRAVVWEGLYHMARRDAIQEGDGEAITDFWRMDLVLLWTREHLQLFNSGHQLLTGIEGFYPQRVRQDMKWNRVLNLQGKAGGNISLDLLTELMINEFKGVIQFGKGSFTRQQVEHSAQLAGPQAKDLDRLFFIGGNPVNLSWYLSRLTSLSCKRKEDVSRFVEEFKKDELFRFKPGRKHEGFNKFTYQQRIKKPKRMGRTMRSLAEELDRQRDMIL